MLRLLSDPFDGNHLPCIHVKSISIKNLMEALELFMNKFNNPKIMLFLKYMSIFVNFFYAD